MSLFFGLDKLVGGWNRYLSRYNLYEVRHNPNVVLTKRRLNQWRVDTPKGFAFVVEADPAVGEEMAALTARNESAVNEQIETLWGETQAKSEALGAKAILIRTPPTFTPSDRSRQLIHDLGEKFNNRQKAKIIWESSGLWEPVTTRDLAQDAGLIYAIDPFLFKRDGGEPSHGDACFIVNERAGARRQFDVYDFEEMLEWGENYQRLFVLLRGRFQRSHGRTFSELVQSEQEPEIDF